MKTQELASHPPHDTQLPVIEEKHLLPNGFLLLFTPDCPVSVRTALLQRITNQGEKWLSPQDMIPVDSQREIYAEPPNFTDAETSTTTHPLFIKKNPRDKKPDETLKVSHFSRSVVHELRTSYALHDIIERHQHELPQKITFQGQSLQIKYHSQIPWGAVIDTHDQDSRVMMIQRESGSSIRSEVRSAGAWNYLSQEKRELFSQIHRLLHTLSIICVDEGLEPWDMGVHQVLYTIDQDQATITIAIIDTEEYNFPEKFGHHWTQGLIETGLTPVIFYLYP